LLIALAFICILGFFHEQSIKKDNLINIMSRKIIFLLMLAILPVMLKAQDSGSYERANFVSGKDTLPYRILLPRNFDESKKYPVLFFLHGAGERGNDNQSQLVHGSKLFLKDESREKFPAIIIVPQCPANSFWSNVKIESPEKWGFTFQKGGKPTLAMELLIKLVKDIQAKPYADRSRFYVGGLSMGGMGTLEILRRQRKTFAAAFSICGGDNVGNVKKYRKVPIWFFHGGKDDVVPPVNSERVVAALKTMGAEVKFTVYPEANHNSWDQAFAEPEFLSWLFSHSKK
jgi:predicted peptidase